MKLLQRITSIFDKRSGSGLTNPEPWLLNAMGYVPTSAGVAVTEQSSIRLTTVYACVRLLSWTLASLPLNVYENMERGKRKVPAHSAYRLLHDRPNPEQTSFGFRSLGMAHLCLYGNFYAEKEYGPGGKLLALWPLAPWRVQVRRTQNMEKVYEIAMPDGSSKVLAAYQVLHIKSLAIDSDKGLSPIDAARQAIGLGLAAEQFGASFFGSGANVSGVAQHPGKLSEAGSKNLRNSLNEKYAGLGNAHRIMLLEEGMTYQRIGIPPEEAQFLETQKFTVSQIARIYNVPMHMLQEHEKSTSWGSGIEEMVLGFIKFTMQPWFVNWEQEINHEIFDARERGQYYAEFVVEGLLRGDSKARAEFYSKLFQVGGFSVNDILEKENMNPIGPEGDERFVPVNMMPLKHALLQPADPQGHDPPEQSRAISAGSREKRSGQARQRIANSYKRVIEDAGRRIIRREQADVMRQAKSMMGSRSNSQAFREWLTEFYKKHPAFVIRQMLPVAMSLAEAIMAEVAAEVDAAAGMTREMEQFVEEYVAAYSERHVQSSERQLLQVIEQAYEDGEDEIEAMQERFDEWEERRPGKIAMDEVVRINGAVTRFALAAYGITRLIWKNTGAKTCEFCEGLHDKVVGVEQPFIPANTSIEGVDGSGQRLTVYGPKMHPPIHRGCQCVIEAD